MRKVELQLLADQNGYRDFDIAGMAGIRRACPGLYPGSQLPSQRGGA